MATYEKLKQNDEAEMLRKGELAAAADDDKSSSGDSTVVAKPAWLEFMDRERPETKSRSVTMLLVSVLISMLGVLFLLAWVAVRINQFSLTTSSTHTHQHVTEPAVSTSVCGNTHAQALAAGCHFDIFSFAWYPRECSDMELYNQTLEVLEKQRMGDAVFFTRGKAGSSYYDALDIGLVQDYGNGKHHARGIASDDSVILTTWEHYLVSCTYAWQKVQRAAMRNWPLEEWSSSLALARKCGPDLLDREQHESKTIVSNLKVWYPKCGLEVEDLKKEVATALRY